MAVLFIFVVILIFCLYGGKGVAIYIGAMFVVVLITVIVAEYKNNKERKELEKKGPKIIYPNKKVKSANYGSGVLYRNYGNKKNFNNSTPRMNTQRTASRNSGQRISETERYIREEERWHAWECPHGDSYECDCD